MDARDAQRTRWHLRRFDAFVSIASFALNDNRSFVGWAEQREAHHPASRTAWASPGCRRAQPILQSIALQCSISHCTSSRWGKLELIIARHNRDGFFKYYTPEAAILTLEGGSRKWSSPVLFNDPFDNQFSLDFTDPSDELAIQVFEGIDKVLTSREPVRPDQLGSHTEMAEFLRQLRQSDVDFRYTEDDIACMKEIILGMMNDLKKRAPETSNEIRRLLSDIIVFCVSERNDNILMWSHYATNHTGIVIKFLALQELDSPPILAQPVRYS